MPSSSSWLIGLLLCVGSLTATAAPPAGPAVQIQVRDAWIRWLPANVPGAGYMTVTNTGAAARMLTGASSRDYGDVSMHQTRVRNGMNEMTPVESVELIPLRPVRFAEGGYHLMLLHPKRSLKVGDRVLIALHFAQGPPLEIPFEVRAGNPP